MRKPLLLFVMLLMLISPLSAVAKETQKTASISLPKINRWNLDDSYEISAKTLTVHSQPDIHSPVQFTLYHGMEINPTEVQIIGGYRWFRITERNFWIAAIEPGGISNLTIKDSSQANYIEDYYGILEMPHRYAVKMVKEPGAVGRIETYRKESAGYILQNTYEISYRKEGEKTKYGDLKTIGGNVVRYLYRTTRSSMNGWDNDGEPFGVFKTSFPMPHDGLPHLLAGKINTYQYNKLPAINRHLNGELMPHPGSYMGADIVLHTKRKGSRGCINVENEAMAYLYHEDLVTELNTQIIPLIIYDEGVIAPPIGTLLD